MRDVHPAGKTNPLHSNNFAELYIAIAYHWDTVRDQMVTLIGAKLDGIRNAPQYNDKYWKMLDWMWKEKLFDCALRTAHREVPTKPEHWVVKGTDCIIACKCGFKSGKAVEILAHVDQILK